MEGVVHERLSHASPQACGVRVTSYSVWRGSDADVLRLVCVIVYVGGVVGAAPCRPRSVRVVPEEVHHVAVGIRDAVVLLVAERTTYVAMW